MPDLPSRDAKTPIIHPAPTTHRQHTQEEQEASGTTPDTVRLSVGLESVEDVAADPEQAIAVATE